ncbi:MAG: FAD-dependent oxidoreductase, partial [Pseudomonadota bacterium]
MKVAVVGAGVLGSVIAWRLAQAGAEVQLYDPSPGVGASGGSLAWLNASFADDPVYNRLRHDSLQIWAELKEQNPELPIVFSGAILWEQEHFDLPKIHASQQDLGRPARMLDRNAHLSAEPEVPEPPERTLALDADGYGNPIEITAWFQAMAKAEGAAFVAADVTGLQVEEGHVTGVQTAGRTIATEAVVLAAGVKLAELLEPLNLRMAMDNQPGLLVTTSPAPLAIRAMLATDGLHGWQGPDGRYLIGADFGGGTEFGDTEGFAAKLVERLGDLIPSAAGRSVEKITVRERPMPADGRPAIGPIGPKGLYAVCTHSGMTLA